MSAKTIYDRLRTNGMTHEAACGMLGNMYAESTLQSNIAQRGMTSYSDSEYTSRWDENPDFGVNGRVGYGLCQWTYNIRQRNLVNFARSKGVSVGDEQMQVDFCCLELQNEYSALWNYLCSCDDMFTATSRICREYERPAVNNIDARYSYAQRYDGYRGYHNVPTSDSGGTTSTGSVRTVTGIRTLQAWLTDNGIDVGTIDGIPGEKLRKGINELLERLGG